MKNILIFFIITLLCFTQVSFSYEPAEGQITATLGPNLNKTNFSNDINSEINAAYLRGFGLVTVGDINLKGGLEIGIFYMPRQYFLKREAQLLVEKIQEIHISMGYRKFINPYFSSSLSFYSSYSMGEPQILYSSFPNDSELNTSARDITEYGFDGAIQSEFWSHDKFAIIFEGRYSLSVTSKKNEKADQYGFLLGIRYLVSAKK
jgi:hypothetical protein